MNKTNKTIIYYTSNAEDPVFEQKIIDDLVTKVGKIPIISVSQIPFNLGRNIYVGKHGHSYINEWKQILVGCEVATTEYVVMAESDFLYPEEYFEFVPSGENMYRYDPVWLMYLNKNVSNFHRKRYSEGAQMVKREWFMGVLEKFLKNYPGWYDESFGNKNFHSPYNKQTHTMFYGKNPCVSIKSFDGSKRRTNHLQGEENMSKDLPYWGSIKELRERFL